MEKDREESMRLAECKPGFKFACTVCKKRFHDYANMCRHRRLAHQRHLLSSKKPKMCDNKDAPSDGKKSISDSIRFHYEPNSYFYNNVARNISENLKYFVEGGVDDIQNHAAYIRWKSDKPRNSSAATETSTKESSSNSAPTNARQNKDKDNALTKYNFPIGFTFTKSYSEVSGEENCERGSPKSDVSGNKPLADHTPEVDLHPITVTTPAPPRPPRPWAPPPTAKPEAHMSDGVPHFFPIDTPSHPPIYPQRRSFDTFQISSGSVIQLPEPQTEPYNFSTKPDDVASQSSKTQSESTLPIKTPSFKLCAVCRSIFSNEEMYQKHMMDKHKISVEASATSVKENVPILPAHNVPPVLTEVTVCSSDVSPPGLGESSSARSPRTCLIVPQVLRPAHKPLSSAREDNSNTGVIDLSPTAAQRAIDLSKSSDNWNSNARDSIDLTCRETVLESPKAKISKCAPGKNKTKSSTNRVVLQTPKVIPRFENPDQKTGTKTWQRVASHTNGLKIPSFPVPVLDLTKDGNPSGLGNYQDVDPCLMAGVVDYSKRQGPDEVSSAQKAPHQPPESTNQDKPAERATKSWCYRPSYNPNPVGLLNVCTSQVPSPTG